jgi:serine/threonine protein kinase
MAAPSRATVSGPWRAAQKVRPAALQVLGRARRTRQAMAAARAHGADRLVGGRYRLREPVGAGGMGAVYRACDERSQRDVAVKLMNARLARDPVHARRFRAEAELGARLAHPHIVAVLDAGTDFIVMELIRGPSARVLLRRRGRLEPFEAVLLLGQVCAALQHAHDHGVVHQDVSPGNILVGQGGRTAKLADFGLAGAVGEVARACGADTVGTPGYVAPEVAAGAAPSPASDLYSLGVVAHRFLAGRPRIRSADPDATAPLPTAVTPPPPSLAEDRPDLPVGLVDAVERALDPDPAARQASAEEFRNRLVAGLRPELALAA